jgi:outer membrane protein OmpA-like peptidoglycan-associated protein
MAPDDNVTYRKFFRQVIEIIEGKRYPVNNFTVREIFRTEKPTDISLVLDYSGSMGGKSIESLEKACKSFIQHKNPKDRISIVKFDDSLAVVSPLEKDINVLLKNVKFEGLRDFGRSTALYAAGDIGLSSLDSSTNNKMIILFTDGYENSSFIYYMTRAFTAQQLAMGARKSGTKINVVSFGGNTNEVVLSFLAIVGSGKLYNIRRTKQIEEVMNEISIATHRYYEVTYKPAVAPGERIIELTYNNNQQPFVTTQTKAYTDETYNLTKAEFNDGLSNNNPVYDTIRQISNKQPIIPPQVIALFNFDKTEVLPEDEERINKYVEYMKSHPKCEILLSGHTDLKGTDRYCYRLSYNRAIAIKKVFVSAGIKSNRIKTIGYGKSNPVWKDEANEMQAKENRRVEVIILE